MTTTVDLNGLMANPLSRQHHAHRGVTVPALRAWAKDRVLYPCSCDSQWLCKITPLLEAARISFATIARGALPVALFLSASPPADVAELLASRAPGAAASEVFMTFVEAAETGCEVRFHGSWEN